MNQQFGKGDIAFLKNPRGEDFRVKIVEVIQDEDNSYWYEVEATDFDTFHREVPQSQLKEA